MKTQDFFKNSHLGTDQKLKFRIWLQKEFTERCRKNPKYSLRAFANLLGLEASTVSQMLAGKRAPSKGSLLNICEKLSATPKELKLMGVAQDSSNSSDDFYQLSVDTFAVLADWYHFAILELTYVTDFKSEPKWISQQLGISVQEAKSAIERLLRLNLMSETKGTYRKTHESVTNHTGINTSVARKTLQKQIIAKALAAVDETPQEEKDITSITMAIDPKNLDSARELIKTFRRELCALTEQGAPSRVYNLAVQLYPVSKKSEEIL